MSIQLAIFDMAGTTVEDDGFVAQAFVNAFEKNGFTISIADTHPYMGVKKINAVKMMLKVLGVDFTEEQAEKIHTDFVNEMINFYETDANIKPFSDTEKVFTALKEKGIKVALDTGFPHNIAAAIVKRFGWKENGLINDFIGSDEVADGRPHPYMIEELMRRNNITDKAAVIKTGDTVIDIEEGQNAGCAYVIAVTTGSGKLDELTVAKPTHIINNLSELLTII